MAVDDLTIRQVKELAALLRTDCYALNDCVVTDIPVGKNILVRGITLYYVGFCEKVTKDEIVLSKTSWVADTGRFNQALVTGVLSEIEPYPGGGIVIINRGAVMDISIWDHDLPCKVK